MVNDGGPAFPHLADCCQRVDESVMYSGLSIRDWFAGQALIARAPRWSVTGQGPDDIAIDCYRLADAMLKAREVPDAK